MIEQNGKDWYKPSEIAEQAMIKNSVGKGDYRFIIRLIKNGRLKSETWNTAGDKSYYIVSHDEIKRYNEARFGQ